MMAADTGAGNEDLPDSVQTVGKLMNAIERLRGERDSLRCERDDLQRDFEFLKVESKFAIETLQKKTDVPTNAPLTISSARQDPSPQLQRAFSVSVLVAQHLQAQQQLDAARADRLSIALAQSQNQLSSSQKHMQDRVASIKKIEREDMAMRDALTTAEVKLASSESRLVDLTSLVRRLEEDGAQERASREELGETLAHTESRLAQVSKTLEDTEAQRASLALQVSHLTQDLDTAKADLLDAESNYSTLQAQQLASMTDNAAKRALKEQIEVLEGRVLRRTEQIGIHQHDIKRLETNLRLQEDRVTELTADLEVAEAEKKAMVEDCSNTREERDEALKRCEKLDEDIEMLDESRGSEVEALVGVIVKSIDDRRAVSRQLERYRGEYLSLSTELQRIAEARVHSVQQAEQLQADHGNTLALLEKTSAQLQSSQAELREASGEAKQATIALATLHQDLRGSAAALHDSEGSRMSIEQQFQAVRTDLQAKLEELSALRTEYEILRSRDTERAAEFEHTHTERAARVAELENRCEELQRAEVEAREQHQRTLGDLEAAKAQISAHDVANAEQAQREAEMIQGIEDAHTQFDTETSALREQLSAAHTELEKVRLLQAESERAHRQALDDNENVRRELQQSLQETVEKLEMRAKVAGDLETMQTQYEEEIDSLKERLHSGERELEDLKKVRDEHMTEHARVVEELERQREEASRILHDKESVDAELSEVRMCLEGEVKSLESTINALERERDTLKQEHANLEVRHDQGTHEREELEAQLQKTTTELDLVRLELSSEMRGRTEQGSALEELQKRGAQAEEECAELRMRVDDLQTKLDESEAKLSEAVVHVSGAAEVQGRVADLQDKLDAAHALLREKQEQAGHASEEHEALLAETSNLRARLQETETALGTLKEEEGHLLTESTSLQAEMQKLLSERRFLENTIQSSQSDVASLKKQLEDSRVTQVEWEKAARSAEVKLDLQAAQHNKAIDSLRKELLALQETAKLEGTVLDLQDRITEMEELLKAKCQEIEENDDRFITFLKTEKKLTSKVEFLTRKVKTLQDKLAASTSEDSTPTAVPLPIASTSSRPSSSRPSYPPPPTRAVPSLPEMPDFSAAASSSRMRSSSAGTRPISPEDRMPQPVFRPRTPETRYTPTLPTYIPPQPQSSQPQPLQSAFTMSTSTSTSSSIGKKRRAPDDFEDCDDVPPQTFTADSVPHRGGATTPRIRRALANVRTGFTPVRHARPVPEPSRDSPPRRPAAGTSIIADVTNSPRSKSGQAGKRGWLGKIKGGAGHSRTTTSSRGRPQNAGP